MAFFLDRTRGIESRSVAVSATAVNYTFDPFRVVPFTGLLLVDLQQAVPTGTTATLPIQFGGVQLLTSNGADATVADLGGLTGTNTLALVYYNSRTGRLQMVSLYTAAATVAAATTPATGNE